MMMNNIKKNSFILLNSEYNVYSINYIKSVQHILYSIHVSLYKYKPAFER